MAARHVFFATVGAVAIAVAAGVSAQPSIDADLAGAVIVPRPAAMPRQHLRAEHAGGQQSHLVALGNTLFSSPLLFGERARGVGLSCNACHINGHNNPQLFIPGSSTRPGNLDPTGPHFNARADNGVSDPVDIPSLRGIRLTAPYGRDGRTASLREFTRDVIVGEFGGAEPTPLMLDALVAYMNEFEFLPNALLRPDGALREAASPAARRGEALFHRPFASNARLSCASCHDPNAAFLDRRAHDVGSGGRFDTPTLLNANSSGPYFHDGRYATYGEVVAHFDRVYALGLTETERADLVAYLEAVGAADEPEDELSFRREMGELATYVGVLGRTLAERDTAITRLVVDTVNHEMERMAAWFPTGEPATRQSQRPDRRLRPVDYPALTRGLDAVARAAESGEFDEARRRLDAYFDLAGSMVSNYPRPR